MTLIETNNLTIDEAVALTDAIRSSVADLEILVVRAYLGRAWIPMGYSTWDNYIDGEFKRAPLALPREDRRSQVLSLRQQGLSLPAIAAVTGVSHQTAMRDTQLVQNGQVAIPERSTGLDGRERPTSRPISPPREISDGIDQTPIAEPIVPAPRERCPTCGQTLPV